MTKISVVIPTRERADVLAFALRTVTAQAYDDLEIVVSDNFSGDDTREVVTAVNDKRVKYVNTGRRVSMSENWELALSHVTGDWVTIMGDDDGLLPGALTRVSELIRVTRARAIRSRTCFFSWPALTQTPSGVLIVPLQTGHRVRDSQVWLSRLLEGRATYFDLPMLYNGGFVRTDVLAELRHRTGNVLLSCTPDVYTAIAIASVTPSYVFSNEPFSISGTSAHSTGKSFFSGEKVRRDAPAKAFAAEGNYPLHPDIPYTATGGYPLSIQALVYESYRQSASLRGADRERHAEQLELILATAGKHGPAVEAWAEIFAQQHGLDLARARSRSRRHAIRLRLEALPSQVADAVNRAIVGSISNPIGDVYEASRVAATIRNDLPGGVTRVYRAAERLVSARRS